MKPNHELILSPDLDRLSKIYSVVRRQASVPVMQIIGIDWGIKRDGRKRLFFGNKVVA